MSLNQKMKLVLRNDSPNIPKTVAGFKIVKTVNTLDYGVPGKRLTREAVDKILTSQKATRGQLTVEFIGK